MLMLLRAYVIFMGAFFLWALVVTPDMDTSFRSRYGASQSRRRRRREETQQKVNSRSQDPWAQYARTTQQQLTAGSSEESDEPQQSK